MKQQRQKDPEYLDKKQVWDIVNALTCLLNTFAPLIADELVYIWTRKNTPNGTMPVNW